MISKFHRALPLGLAGFLWTSAALASPGLTLTQTLMRSGPGPNYPIVMRIPGSATIDVESCQPTWCRVSWQYQSGYIPTADLDHGPDVANARYGRPREVYGPPPVYYGPPPVYEGPPPVVVDRFAGPHWGFYAGW